MAVALALCAAFAFAVASVIQQHAASGVPAGDEGGGAMVRRLVRDPLWLLGGVADIGAFLLHAAALHEGGLALVQPLLPLGLVFALALSARVQHLPHGARSWSAALAVAAGAAVFLLAARPHGGVSVPSSVDWRWALIGVLVPAAGLVVASWVVRAARRRAGCLALATGLIYGLTAALTKATVDGLGRGVGHGLTTWYPYALVVMGGVGLVTGQRAFQAAPLAASLPLLTISDPLVGTALGLGLYHERLQVGGFAGVAAMVAAITMVVGVVVLARESRLPGSPSEA